MSSTSPNTKTHLNGDTNFYQQNINNNDRNKKQTYLTFTSSPNDRTPLANVSNSQHDYFSTNIDSPSGNSSPSISKPFLNRYHGRGRGMTIEEVHAGGIISEEERSITDFQDKDIPIEEKDIKKLPRKVRGYYEDLSTIYGHYEEVDDILSGSLPYDIAVSFSPQKPYTPFNDDDDHGHQNRFSSSGSTSNSNRSKSRERWRRDSAWKIKKQTNHHDSISENEENPNVHEQVNENTNLLNGFMGEDDGSLSREEKRERLARLALNVNTIVNILLVAAKVIAVLYSSSISLTASLVDSALDLLSTMIILGTSWAIGVKTDKHKYPAGKRRFEPLGVLIFSVAMIASFVQVFIESFQRAIGPADEEAVDLSWLGIGVMLATIGIKAVLWVWCSRIPSSGVQALAQDAENDVFFNMMSLAFPWIGSFFAWRLLDPIGGMVLSTYIIFEWIKTLLQNFANLSGKSASKDQITRVLYLVSRFNPVLEIADVECYHIGDDLIVEIDVILPRSSSLHFAHDVGETIHLDGVIRAYVHCDYSSQNPAQHTSRPAPLPASQLRQSSNSSEESDTPTPRPTNHIPSVAEGVGGAKLIAKSAKNGVPIESPGEIGL
ncbi:uncharacterized protein L201_003247 [Kwoniella dendrophila CBS 6074]|uniref:Cation efflux protein transmembrane domain-containing protein n=1 Tax=Kwoniella dendrophila CBS 6074 TaxID=1295534 RepID=A0AAX4JSF9_9TREE